MNMMTTQLNQNQNGISKLQFTQQKKKKGKRWRLGRSGKYNSF